MLLIVKEILFVSTIGNVKRTVQRKCVLMLGCKGLIVKQKITTYLIFFRVTDFDPQNVIHQPVNRFVFMKH